MIQGLTPDGVGRILGNSQFPGLSLVVTTDERTALVIRAHGELDQRRKFLVRDPGFNFDSLLAYSEPMSHSGIAGIAQRLVGPG